MNNIPHLGACVTYFYARDDGLSEFIDPRIITFEPVNDKLTIPHLLLQVSSAPLSLSSLNPLHLKYRGYQSAWLAARLCPLDAEVLMRGRVVEPRISYPSFN